MLGTSALAEMALSDQLILSTIDAEKVPSSRRVEFAGGDRVVSFEGSKRLVEFP